MSTRTARRRHSPTDAERHAREEARAEQLTKVLEQLTAGVLELVKGESWQAMLWDSPTFSCCKRSQSAVPHSAPVS
jgi:hypothetical protein